MNFPMRVPSKLFCRRDGVSQLIGKKDGEMAHEFGFSPWEKEIDSFLPKRPVGLQQFNGIPKETPSFLTKGLDGLEHKTIQPNKKPSGSNRGRETMGLDDGSFLSVTRALFPTWSLSMTLSTRRIQISRKPTGHGPRSPTTNDSLWQCIYVVGSKCECLGWTHCSRSPFLHNTL